LAAARTAVYDPLDSISVSALATPNPTSTTDRVPNSTIDCAA
jgi:hypothetical protein